MPSESKSQSRFFRLVAAIKAGKAHGSPKAEAAAKGMSAESISHYTETKQKDLPEKKAKMEKEAGVMKAMDELKGFMGKVAGVGTGPAAGNQFAQAMLRIAALGKPEGAALAASQGLTQRVKSAEKAAKKVGELHPEDIEALHASDMDPMANVIMNKKIPGVSTAGLSDMRGSAAGLLNAVRNVRIPKAAEEARLSNLCKAASEFIQPPTIKSPMAYYNGYMDKTAMEGERIERYVLAHPANVPSAAIAGALMKAAGEEVMDGERFSVVEGFVEHIRKTAAITVPPELLAAVAKTPNLQLGEAVRMFPKAPWGDPETLSTLLEMAKMRKTAEAKDESSDVARFVAGLNDSRRSYKHMSMDIDKSKNDHLRRKGFIDTAVKNLEQPFYAAKDMVKGEVPLLVTDEEGREKAKEWFRKYYGVEAAPTKPETTIKKTAAVSPLEFKNLLQNLQAGRLAGRASNASQYGSHIFNQAPEKVLAFLKTPTNTLAGHYGVDEAAIEELKNAFKASPVYKSKFERSANPAAGTRASPGTQTGATTQKANPPQTGAATPPPSAPPTGLAEVPTGNEAALSNAYINEARKLDALRGQSAKLGDMAKGLRSKNKKLAYIGLPAALATGVAGTAAYNAA